MTLHCLLMTRKLLIIMMIGRKWLNNNKKLKNNLDNLIKENKNKYNKKDKNNKLRNKIIMIIKEKNKLNDCVLN